MTRASALLLKVLLTGCTTYSGWRYREFTDVAKDFFDAASQNDFAAAALASDSLPMDRVRIIAEAEPSLLDAAARELAPVAGTILEDAAIVDFTLEYRGNRETFSISYRRVGGRWLISSFLVPSRS